jgi:hypothetical protein
VDNFLWPLSVKIGKHGVTPFSSTTLVTSDNVVAGASVFGIHFVWDYFCSAV